MRDYDLAATLNSGQAFRWRKVGAAWEGVVAGHWVSLCATEPGWVTATTLRPGDWGWLTDYLQLDVDLSAILQGFPDDRPLRDAVEACRGLRLLRQDPWECLASFVLSSTKQIVQIRRIVATLCERFGSPVAVPAGHAPEFAFPTAARLAGGSEEELRACKMGFRARYLWRVAQRVAAGELDLAGLGNRPLTPARAALMNLPGVGRKIADCVLLFSLGFAAAFPIDVWVIKALRALYFQGRRVSLPRLQAFATAHFGPYAGYAQQYLFHHMRLKAGRAKAAVAAA